MDSITLDKANADDITAFEVMFRGFMSWGNSPMNVQKGPRILLREQRILTAFEAISSPCKCGRMVATDEPDRELNEGPQEFKIAKTEDFDHLVLAIENAPWGCGKVTNNVLRVLAWLRNLNV